MEEQEEEQEKEESVPGHPSVDVSSRPWTSSRCPFLRAWRLHRRQLDCMVGSPWTERSGRSGCLETGWLQKERTWVDILDYTWIKIATGLFLVASNKNQLASECPVELQPILTRGIFRISRQWSVTLPSSTASVLRLRIILHLNIRGIIRLNPLQRQKFTSSPII